MAWTTPATWSADEVVTAAKMITHVKENLDYLIALFDTATGHDHSGDTHDGKTQVKEGKKWWPAPLWWPDVNNPCADLAPRNSNDRTYMVLGFDDTTVELAETNFVLPDDWNEGTVKATVYWLPASGGAAETVYWQLKAMALADGDTWTTASWGSAVAVADTWLAATKLHITAQTAEITIAGTPVAGKLLQWQISRDVATDNLVGDAQLVGVLFEYTRVY